MDVSNAILAKSDQLNSSDLTGGPQTVTILEVSQGSAEQPVNITTDVFGKGRPFKPSKTVLRILAAAWGKETAAWVGRRMTVYRDPTVRWAGEEIGGIRVSALSHIDKAAVFNLPTSKGKFAKSTITVLLDADPSNAATSRDWLAELDLAGTDLDAVASLGASASRNHAPDDVVNTIRARWTELDKARKA
jgi:hypothetical protein